MKKRFTKNTVNENITKKRNLWHFKNISQIEETLHTNIKDGLTSAQAQERLKQNGANKIDTQKPMPWFLIFLKGLFEPLSAILLVCAILTLALPFVFGDLPTSTEYIEFGVIMLTVFVNSTIGTVQEIKARGSVQALKKLSSPKAIVIRDGKEMEIDAVNLVVGDIAILKVGQFVPADFRLFEVSQFNTDESALTGEPEPIHKNAEVIEIESLMLAEQKNIAFMSTVVVSGWAKGILVENAKTSEMGRIATSISEKKKVSTPLQTRLSKVTRNVTFISIGIAVALMTILFIQNALNFGEHMNVADIIILSISSAIAIIPASLTIIVSVILSLSTKKMSYKNVIVKSLSSIETLGEVNIICSDKTGTLTQNNMTVVKFSLNHNINNAQSYNYVVDSSLDNHFVNAMGLNNDAVINSDGQRLGLPTELSLVDFLAKSDIDTKTMQLKFPRVDDLPFSSDTKTMTTVNRIGDKDYIYVKGALDRILKNCKYINISDEVVKLTSEDKSKIMDNMDKMSNEALRVISFAYREKKEHDNQQTYNKDLIFLGMVGIIDPPRPEAIAAVKEARSSGIRTVMITGDHAATALAIAKKIGIANEESIVISGEELDAMDDKDLISKLPKADVFARVNPEHKTRIVQAFQSKGLIVAMTGDGINDAPSLRKADVGIAMGLGGTDAAKEAANLILADDNFASIIRGVEEGRSAYLKIKKATGFVLGANPQVLAMFIVILALGFSPLTSINILWFNMIVETLLAIPIGMAATSKNLMNQKPVKVNDSIFKGIWPVMLISFLSFSICVTIGTIIGYEWAIDSGLSESVAQQIGITCSFVIITTSPIFIVILIMPINPNRYIKWIRNKINWWLIGAMVIAFALNIFVYFTPWINENVFSIYSDIPWWLWLTCFGISLIPFTSIFTYWLLIRFIYVYRYHKIKNENINQQKNISKNKKRSVNV